jgi:pentose-5-phosphate-3-epimerase
MLVALYTVFISRPPVTLLSVARYSHLSDTSQANPIALIKSIHDRNMKAGVAISPDTPSTAITDEIANAADMLLVMTVYPGLICPHIAMDSFIDHTSRSWWPEVP